MDNEDIQQRERPLMVVYAPGLEFVHKYFDREFDRDIAGNLPDDGPNPEAAVMVASTLDAKADTSAFTAWCGRRELRPIVIRVPHIIGTGMTGLPLALARGVLRGTMLTVRDNEARIAVIHAVDIPRVARMILEDTATDPVDIIASAPAVGVNDLVEALGRRIKDKRVGSIKPRWARVLYGAERYGELTTDYGVDTSAFDRRFPGFVFVNPVEYLTTHVYDHESL